MDFGEEIGIRCREAEVGGAEGEVDVVDDLVVGGWSVGLFWRYGCGGGEEGLGPIVDGGGDVGLRLRERNFEVGSEGAGQIC